MPTDACTTACDVSPEQRARIAESVTAIHAAEADAPRCFVQVIFDRVEPGAILIAGEPASPDHVWVRADIRAGRSAEQKAKILTRIMRETSAILGTSEQDVWVYVSDIPAQGVLEFGNVLPPPGGAAEWLAGLTEELREKLSRAD